MLPGQTAGAAGVFVDAADGVRFISFPHAKSFATRLIRTNGDLLDGSLFVLDAAFPVRSYLLVETELTFISLAGSGEIQTGFGDFMIRARARLYNRGGLELGLISSFRTGTGTARLFPYSSQSFDLELGVSVVDTLELLQVWGVLSGTSVSREPEDLPDPEIHESFLTLGAGIALPVSSSVAMRLGATFMAFRSGAFRELYFARFDYAYSPYLSLFASIQAEAGERAERVSNVSGTLGLRVFY